MLGSNESVEMCSAMAEKDPQRVQLAADIFAEHGKAILAIIQSQIGSEYEADDIFQEFFLSLVHQPVPKHIKDVRKYLSRAVKNDIVDAIRRTQSYRTRLRKYAEHTKHRPTMNGPAEKVMRDEQTEKMFNVVRSELCAHEADAIVYRYKYGETTGDVAEMMGVNKRSLSRYVCVGLKKLREVLAADERKVQIFVSQLSFGEKTCG